MTIAVFDERKCSLGEGAFWHPEREQLFWFDINAKQLLTQGVKGPDHWQFEEHVSAAGWVEKAILLVASSKALIRFNIETGDQTVAEKQDHMDRGKTATPSQQRPLVDKTTAQRERSLTSQGSTTMSLWCDSTDFFQVIEFDEK